MINFACCAIVRDDSETFVIHVEDQVLALSGRIKATLNTMIIEDQP